MKLAILIGAGAALAAVVLAACARLLPRDLRDKKLDERATVTLSGVATAQLPPTFKLEGIVNSGERTWFGGELTPLEYHLDERRLTFRFVQGQHHVAGGYRAYPVILDVTLVNPSAAAQDVEQVSATTIDRFYSPDDKTTLASASWLPEEREGSQVTHTAEAIDPYDKKHARWLLIHTDTARRVRADLFAWRDAYTIAEARELVRNVTASVSISPALERHFAEIKTFDKRMELRRDSMTAAIARDLSACKLPPLAPGTTVGSDDCVALLSANRRMLHVARYLGAVPLTPGNSVEPQLPLAFGPNDYRGFGTIDGRPNLEIFVLWWDQGRSAWRTSKLQGLAGSDDLADVLEPHVASRLSAREHAHLFRYAEIDLVFHPNRISMKDFLGEAARLEADLAGGKVVAGVNATKPSLGKP